MNQAFGTTFSWNSQTVAKLTKISSPEINIDMQDSTNHQSTGGFEEVLPGLIRTGEVSIEGFLQSDDANGQVAMMTDAVAKTLRTAVVTFPAATGTTWTFSAYVSKIKMGEADINNNIPFSASLKVTGAPVFAVATSAGLTTPFLAFSTGTIIPAASQAVTSYVLEVITGTASITITPTAAAGVITITANGVSQVVTSGVASTAIALGAAGSVTPVTVSIQETNKAPKVYAIQVARA